MNALANKGRVGLGVLAGLVWAASLYAGPQDSALVKFGLSELAQTGDAAPFTLQFDESLPAQAYTFDPDASVLRGGDERGLMYGLLEAAERVRLRGPDALRNGFEGTPFIVNRGVKFNIPLDARTPGYDDTGDAAQRNIAEMWNLDFWTEFFDQMARDRYNMISFWNPHPFPSMVESAEFPDVALDDVMVTTAVPNGRENEWGEPQLVSRTVMENLRTAKVIPIADKITFWQQVMQHAANRGIDVYWITWNICLNSVAQPVPDYYRTYGTTVPDETPGKYGVTYDINNQQTVRYLRDAVKTFLLTYPHVTGIGVTAGEHFVATKGPRVDREDWLWATYGEGILDAKKEQPDRHVNFIHRVWNTDFSTIMDRWEAYPDTFEISFKYAKARLYSSPDIPFADGLVEAMKPLGLKSWWNLRNDDIFVHRWGDPDYVRAFVQNFDREATAGFHLGSDGYVWGREFISKQPKSPRELEIHKHWYAHMLWGRLAYDPGLDREFFVTRIGDRHPDTDAETLHDAWQAASGIIPLVNRFYWRNWDFMWSPENSNSHGEGFHGVRWFMDNQPMQGSGILSIRDYVAARNEGRSLNGTPPFDVAKQLDQLAATALQGCTELEESSNSRDLAATLADIRSQANLGRYYAHKIRAATALAAFEHTPEDSAAEAARTEIQNAYDVLTVFVDNIQKRYHSQMLARPGPLHWSVFLSHARKDVAEVHKMTASHP